MQLKAVRGNESWTLSGGGVTYRVATTGIGLGSVRRLRQRGPFQHGVANKGFRLDERKLYVTLYFQATSLADADARRDTLAEIFKPLASTPVGLRFTRDDGQVRQIDGYLDGELDFADTPTEDRVGVSQRVQIPFLPMDADPVFYDPTLRRVRFTNASAMGIPIPLVVPLVLNANTEINATQPVTYAGNWREYPIIYVTGPADDIQITNETTGETLDLPTLALTSGQVLTIDLRYDHKTVEREDGSNLIAYLTEDSDLATWHLATTPEAAGGVNDIAVAIGADVTGETAVEITYYDRYLHV